MITFDPQTLKNWQEKNIQKISIELITAGCEGTSIRIHENTVLDDFICVDHNHTMITIYASEKDRKILEDSYITWNGSNWILKSESILTRCGCGKSFGIKTGDIRLDKIQLLKSKLKKKDHH